MGVKGLWTLLEPAGYPISLESLEGKIIAVDISIWINQSIKGIRDKRGILAENAHLLGLFNRICKLLFYKIKPVFVFDGGAPALKRQTIEDRRLRRENILSKTKSNVNKVLKSYISDKLQKEIEFDDDDEDELLDAGFGLKEWTAKDDGGIFILPEISPDKKEEKKEEPTEDDWQDFEFSAHPKLRHLQDTSIIDTESDDFKSLPPELRHELLAEMREKKKRLNKVENIPTATSDFSSYQMQRILVRRKIQEKMEEVQEEMVTNISNSAASNLSSNASSEYQGITASRVMSDDSTHFVYLNKRRMDDKNESPKLLMPKRRKEEPQRDFRPAKAYRDLFSSIDEFDFGIKEEAEKEGATSLREKIRKEEPTGPRLKLEFRPVRSKSTKSPVKVKEVQFSSTLVHSESDSDSDNDFVEVEEIQVSDDTSDDQDALSKDISVEDQPSTSGYIIAKTSTDIFDDSSASTVLEDQSRSPISPFKSNDQASKILPLINFDNPVASTSKEADRIELRMASLSTKSTSKSPKKINRSPSAQKSPKPAESVLSYFTRLKKPNQNEEQKIDSDFDLSSDDSDLVIEKEIVSSVKKSKPSNDVTVLEQPETPVIKSHHFAEISTPSLIETPTKPLSSQKSRDQSSKDSPTTVMTPKSSPISSTTPKMPTTPKSSQVSNTPITPKTPFTKTPSKLSPSSPLVTPIKVLRAMDRTDEINEQLRDCKKAERQTSTVAQNMISDCRELLSMFGIPYVMSPMEAEAQCAALEMQGLTHGTITDDSDIWLFGGKTVFKNFFNQSKYVEMYRIDDIEKKLKLDRDTMLCVALLTGCDYTDGIEGVGPVRATEILSEFPGKGIDRLRSFANWWRSKKKGSENKSPGNKMRFHLLKLNLSDNFPSDLVYKAFMSPIVLDSAEKFSWGMPDLDLLRRYAAEKMRWSKEKIDSTLIPIIKKLNEKQNQLRIDQFIKLRTNNNKMAYGSKRMADAVNKMSGSNEQTVEMSLGSKPVNSKLREKVKNQRKKGRGGNQQPKLPKKTTPTKVAKDSNSNGVSVNKKHRLKNLVETLQLSDSSSDN